MDEADQEAGGMRVASIRSRAAGDADAIWCRARDPAGRAVSRDGAVRANLHVHVIHEAQQHETEVCPWIRSVGMRVWHRRAAGYVDDGVFSRSMLDRWQVRDARGAVR